MKKSILVTNGDVLNKTSAVVLVLMIITGYLGFWFWWVLLWFSASMIMRALIYLEAQKKMDAAANDVSEDGEQDAPESN